jgi:hypothetical protein
LNEALCAISTPSTIPFFATRVRKIHARLFLSYYLLCSLKSRNLTAYLDPEWVSTAAGAAVMKDLGELRSGAKIERVEGVGYGF